MTFSFDLQQDKIIMKSCSSPFKSKWSFTGKFKASGKM